MYILLVTIDGQTREDLVRELREALRRVEAGEDRGKHSQPVSSHDFSIRPSALQPPGKPETVGQK